MKYISGSWYVVSYNTYEYILALKVLKNPTVRELV